MKFVVLLLALCAVAHAAHVKPVGFGNAIDDLVKELLEYVRKMMKEHEPLKVPDIPEQVINDDQSKIYVTADLTEVYVSKASEFTIDHIENNLIEFWAKFGVTIPTAHVDGKFKITGTALGKKVEGTGTFSVDVSGLSVTGFIQNELLEDKYLHIKSMTLDYTIQDLKFKEQGLVVEGMTEEQLEQIFNTQLLKFFQDQKAMICDKIATQLTEEINDMIKGKTLQEVIDWLKHLIDPTAASYIA